MKPREERLILIERCEHLCLDLLQTDIDVAHAFLRLAKTETEFGDIPSASELVKKAKRAHDTVMREVQSSVLRLGPEKLEVQRSLRSLAAAIDEAERQCQYRLERPMQTS